MLSPGHWAQGTRTEAIVGGRECFRDLSGTILGRAHLEIDLRAGWPDEPGEHAREATRSWAGQQWRLTRRSILIFLSLLFHLALHRSDLEIAWMLAPSNGE
jgi:hypothetical protein